MHSPVAALVPRVADWRNCALVLGEEALPVLHPWLVGGRLHTFDVPLRIIRTFFRASKGSPFEGAIRKVLGRLTASGKPGSVGSACQRGSSIVLNAFKRLCFTVSKLPITITIISNCFKLRLHDSVHKSQRNSSRHF